MKGDRWLESDYRQLPEEPDLWYGRFHAYLLAGSRRSLLATYNSEREKAGKGAAKSVPSSWNEAADRWRWGARAAAWDAEIRMREEAKWIARREEFRERQWAIAERLIQKGEAMLASPLAGEDAPKWNLRDAAAFLAEGGRLARQAAEMYDGDLNSALTHVYRYYETVAEAIAVYEEGCPEGVMPAKGTKDWEREMGNVEPQ